MPDAEVVRGRSQSERHGPQRDRGMPALVTRHERCALVVRQHCRKDRRRSVPKYDRRKFFRDVAGFPRPMSHTARSVAIEQDGLGLLAGLNLTTGFANDGEQPVAEHLRSAADVVAATGEIRRLRDREMDEGHRVGIVSIVSKVRRQCELDRLVAAEQLPEYLAERRMAVTDQGPQA